MTETYVSYSNVYRGENHRSIAHAVQQAVAAFDERYTESPETVRADENDEGDYEITVRGTSDY